MFNEDEMQIRNGMSATMTIGDWIKYMLLGLINIVPIIGPIAYLVICIILMVNKETNKSLRNFMLAGLIFGAVVFVISVIACAIFLRGSLRLISGSRLL